MFKKRQFDLSLALRREMDLAFSAILKMAGKKSGHKSDGTLILNIGDCQMGRGKNAGVYSTFQRYMVKKIRALGYKVLTDSEYFTSQKFPLVGYPVVQSGNDMIRIKYCKELDIHINRDIMAGENMCDLLVSKIKGLVRPSYLCKDISASQAVNQ